MSKRRGALGSAVSRRAFAGAAVVAVAFTTTSAHADPPPAPAASKAAAVEAPEPAPAPAEKAWETAPPERRYGFTFGVMGGLTLGQAAGFPNNPKKILKQNYYTDTGIGAGGEVTLWFGGALTDWLVFGLGYSLGEFVPSNVVVRDTAFNFHVEVFPVYALGGRFRDLGVMLDAGAGATTASPKGDPDTKLIDGGGVSRIGFGVFYELLRAKKFAFSPYIEGDYMWSDSARRGAFTFGLRTAFYTKP